MWTVQRNITIGAHPSVHHILAYCLDTEVVIDEGMYSVDGDVVLDGELILGPTSSVQINGTLKVRILFYRISIFYLVSLIS